MPSKRRLSFLSVICLIVGLALASCGKPMPDFAAPATTSPDVASPIATASPEPTDQPPVTTSWPERALPKLAAALAHAGVPGDLTQQPGTPDLYGIAVPTPHPPFESPTPAPLPRTGRVERIDLASRQVALGPTVPSGAQLITIGASVYLFTPQEMTAREGPAGPYSLRRISNDALEPSVTLPFLTSGQAVVIATSNPALPDHGLWIAQTEENGRSSLWLVDSQTGRVLQRKTFSGEIRSISPDPAGNRLYLARFTEPWFQATPRSTPSASPATLFGIDRPTSLQVIPVGNGYFPHYVFVDELDAKTGRLIVGDGQETLAAAGGVTAVNAGVWVSTVEGMSSKAMYLLRQSDLKQIAEPRYVPQRLDRDNQAVPVDAAWTGSTFWLESWAGLSCVDPTSGIEQAGITFPNHDGQISGQLTPVASWNRWVYALTGEGQTGTAPLVALKPPAACG